MLLLSISPKYLLSSQTRTVKVNKQRDVLTADLSVRKKSTTQQLHCWLTLGGNIIILLRKKNAILNLA